MKNATAFQIISIEPTQAVVQIVNQTAEKYDLDVNLEHPRQFNAPVCGINYHAQEVCLCGKIKSRDTRLAIRDCIEEIETLTIEALADGYVELL